MSADQAARAGDGSPADLPPLPETPYGLHYEWPDDEDGYGGSEVVGDDGYTADHMRAYALAALAAAPAAAPAAPLTDALLNEAAENWHEYGDGPGIEVSRRKAAKMAYKAGARFAEQQHGIKAIQAPATGDAQ